MSSHTQIATETLTFTDKDGGVHTFDYTIEEEGASSESLPIKMTEVAYVFGTKSDPPEKQIKTTQAQFRIKQENRTLLNRLRGDHDKNFIFRVEETLAPNAKKEIFEGYLHLASKSWTYYERYPVIEFVAYDGLGTLRKTRFDGTLSGVTDFHSYITGLLDLTGFDREYRVYTRRNHQGVTNSDFWPDFYRHNVDNILRSENDQERFAWDALVEFCSRFNFQMFYWEGKWIFMDREQRIRYPDAQKWHDSDFFGSKASGEKNLLVNAGKTGAVHYPSGEDLPGIGRLLYDWNIQEPEIRGLVNPSFTGSLDNWTINGSATHDSQDRASIPIEITDANSIEQTTDDELTPGDTIHLKLDGSVRQDATSEATDFDMDVLEVKLSSLDSATELWLQSDGSWAGSSHVLQQTDIVFNGTASPPDSFPYFISIQSDPIPSDPVDQRFELTVEVHAFASTVNSGANPNGIDYHNNVYHVIDTYETTRTDLATKRFLITTGSPEGRDLELKVDLADDDDSTDSFSMEYDSDGMGTWLNTEDWSSGSDDQQLPYLVALAYAAQQNGSLETPTIQNRIPGVFTPLDTIDFDTEDYILRTVVSYYRRLLHENLIEVQAQEGKFDVDGLDISVLYLDKDGNVTDGPTDTHSPAAPTGLSVESFDGRNAYLDWDDNSESDLAFYYVYRVGETNPIASTFGPNSQLLVDIGEQVAGQECFQVTAINEVGIESPKSTQACATPDAGFLVEATRDTETMNNVGQDYLFAASGSPGYGTQKHDLADVHSIIIIERASVSAEWCVTGAGTFNSLDWQVGIVRTDASDTDGDILSHPRPWPCGESKCCNEFNQEGGLSVSYAPGDQSDIQTKFACTNESASNAHTKSATFQYIYDFVALEISVTALPSQLEVDIESVSQEISVQSYNLYLDGSLHDSGLNAADFPYTITGLTPGQSYTVSVSYVDHDGEESRTTIPLSGTPTAPSETYQPTEDTYADETAPGTPRGAREFFVVKADSGTRRQGFMQFDISGSVISAPVTSATLRITIELSAISTDKTLQVLDVSSDSWDEDTLDWFNRPSLGSVIDSVVNAAADSAGTTYEFDLKDEVDAALGGTGIISVGFYYSATSNDACRFYTKEDTTGGDKPELEIVP